MSLILDRAEDLMKKYNRVSKEHSKAYGETLHFNQTETPKEFFELLAESSRLYEELLRVQAEIAQFVKANLEELKAAGSEILTYLY